MTKYFINHPTPAVVLSIILVLFGILEALKLPIAEYPNIAPPNIGVSTSYPGADISVVNDTVAQIIEEQIKGIDGFDYMSSTVDASGNYDLSIVFKFGVNEDIAAVQVQNKIHEITSELPQVVQNNGLSIGKVNSEMAFMVAFISPNNTYDSLFLKRYADTYFMDKIKRVNGVGTVDNFVGDYSMRVWLNPDKAAELGVTVSDIETAIQEQTARPALGATGKMPVVSTQEKEILGRSQNPKENPADFENIIIRNDGSALIRLKDVAKVEEGPRSFDVTSFFGGKPSFAFSISLNSTANAFETISEIKKILAEAEKTFPPDIEYKVIIDSTTFIEKSLTEVVHTFFEALLLVLIIVFIFLQNFRATIISLLAIPVSLIATFIFFPILGFTINTLTLFAMVLAIGLVVDDAIVVIEIVERNLERGMEIKAATLSAMQEVQKPIIAIACVLAAVFVPVAMMDGITGELYKQFALTIVISMALSSFVALSLTPALCVLILKNRTENTSTFDKFFAQVENFYRGALNFLMLKKFLVIIALFLITFGAFQIYQILPSEYVPDEDKGNIFVAVNLTPGTSLNRTNETLKKIETAINKIDGIKYSSVQSGRDLISGTTSGNAGLILSVLEDWDERDKDIWEIIEEIENVTAEVAPEATILAMSSSNLPGLETVGGLSMCLMDVKGISNLELAEITEKISAAVENCEEIDNGEISFNMSTPYTDFQIDTEKAKMLGVNLNDIYTALRVNFGGDEVADFTKFGRNHKIVLQADASYRSAFDSVKLISVKNSNGEIVPLETFIKFEHAVGSSQISRFNGIKSLNFEGNVAQGYSSGEAMDSLEEIVEEIAPGIFQIEWSGISRQEKLAQSSSVEILALSLVFVFLCLVALYENWTVPFAILLTVPVGIFGAILAEILTENLNSVYTQIGILVIIGLAAKNAILIVEFSKDRIARGEKTFEATINAAVIRLRPILMTSLAFIVACIPLAMATGAGSGARNAMGSAVVGGMFFATIFGIFLVPILFKIIFDRSFK